MPTTDFLTERKVAVKKIHACLGAGLIFYLVMVCIWDFMRYELLDIVGLLFPWSAVLVMLCLFAAPLLLWSHLFSVKTRFETHRRLIKAIVCAVSAWLLAFTLASLYTMYLQLWSVPAFLNNVGSVFGMIFSVSNTLRAAVLLPVCLLAVAMLLYPVGRVLREVFAKRWLIALCVFVLFVLCKINFSNVGAFNSYIQPGLGDDLIYPLFGQVRHIRSDEWLVNLPLSASTEFAGYGEFNDILRGTLNYNFPATGLYLSYSALSDPLNFGYFLFGTEYGVSFFWCASMFLSIMFSLEFAYIISNKSRLMALLGVALIAMSPFNLWWSISTLITGFMGVLVCAHYCFAVKRFYQRCLCMLGVAMSGAFFICQFYPAWQVPMVYILLPIFIWILIDRFEVLRTFRAKEWIAAAVAVVFMASIVLSHLIEISEYTQSIMGTVYPGERFETGGYALTKHFSFIHSFQIPFHDITVGSNNSEAATFFSLFPLPIIMAVSVFVRQIVAKIKDKTEKVDLLNALLLIPAVFLTVYCTVGIPAWLAKITLMSYSPAIRAVDFLAFLNTILLIRFVAAHQRYRFPIPVAAGLVIAVLINSIWHSQQMCPDYLRVPYLVFIVIVAFAFGMACFAKLPKNISRTAVAVFALIAILLGAKVSPINSGIGALTEKPAAEKIQEIVEADPDAKWIGYGNIVVGQYAVANGAPCITSTNYIPNMELWTKLDPDGEYNRVYNRYAHVVLEFTEEETTFELLTPDSMRLNLSYGDLAKTEVKYIFSMSPLEETSDIVDFQFLYQESNVYIYEIVYK